MYVEQAHQRYRPLYGQQSSSWRKPGGLFSSWGRKQKAGEGSYGLENGGLGGNDEIKNVKRDLSGQTHKVRRSLNLAPRWPSLILALAVLLRS